MSGVERSTRGRAAGPVTGVRSALTVAAARVRRSRRPAWRTVPNLVTAVRFALVVPIAVLLLTGASPPAAAVLAAVFGASDWVDGHLARRLGQTSRFGEVFDPVADRVGVGCIAVALAACGAVPWWVVAVFPAVDLAVGGVYLARGRPGLAVTRLGKVRTAAAMAGAFAVMVGLVPGLGPLLPVGRAVLAAGALLHVGAGALYVRRMLRDRPAAAGPGRARSTGRTPRPARTAARPRPGRRRS